MVRKAWAGKVPAFVGMVLPVNKKRKAGGRERWGGCVRYARRGRQLLLQQRCRPSMHRRKLKRPYTVQEAIQEAKFELANGRNHLWAIWPRDPATSLARRVHRTQASFSVGAGVGPEFTSAPWDLLLAFFGPASASTSMCPLLPIQSFPAVSRLLGPYHSLSNLQCYARDAPDVMHTVICSASGVSSCT